jgi:hypothetical protein
MQKIFSLAGKKRTTRILQIYFIIQPSLNPMVEHDLMLA